MFNRNLKLEAMLNDASSVPSQLAELYATEAFPRTTHTSQVCTVTDESFRAVLDFFKKEDYFLREEDKNQAYKSHAVVLNNANNYVCLKRSRNELTFDIFSNYDQMPSSIIEILVNDILAAARGTNNFYRARLKNYDGVSVAACHTPKTTNLDLYPGLDYSAITKAITGKTPGFVLFQGPPGVGKSRLIEHIIANTPEVTFVSIANPQILRGSIEELDYLVNGSVLVIEEGDDFIKDRDNNPKFMPEILEMTDGHLADELRIKFLITTNLKDEDLDKAIIRKNRLLFSQKFRELTKKEVKELNSKGVFSINPDLIEDKMTLADIFGDEDSGIVAKAKPKMGFS